MCLNEPQGVPQPGSSQFEQPMSLPDGNLSGGDVHQPVAYAGEVFLRNRKATKRETVRPATFGYIAGYYPKLVGTALAAPVAALIALPEILNAPEWVWQSFTGSSKGTEAAFE
jgi:hypothetical protein